MGGVFFKCIFYLFEDMWFDRVVNVVVVVICLLIGDMDVSECI